MKQSQLTYYTMLANPSATLKAENKQCTRKIGVGGRISWQGQFYFDDRLLPYVGQKLTVVTYQARPHLLYVVLYWKPLTTLEINLVNHNQPDDCYLLDNYYLGRIRTYNPVTACGFIEFGSGTFATIERGTRMPKGYLPQPGDRVRFDTSDECLEFSLEEIIVSGLEPTDESEDDLTIPADEIINTDHGQPAITEYLALTRLQVEHPKRDKRQVNQGTFTFMGKIYAHPNLVPYNGQKIQVTVTKYNYVIVTNLEGVYICTPFPAHRS